MAITLSIETPTRQTLATTYLQVTIPRNARYLRIRCDHDCYLATTGSDGGALGSDYETYDADTTYYRKIPTGIGKGRPPAAVAVYIAASAGTPDVELTALYEGA
jgi:hypothetical protein